MLSLQKDIFARFAAQFQKEGEGRRESLRDHSPFFNSPRVPVPIPPAPPPLRSPNSVLPRTLGSRHLGPSSLKHKSSNPNPLPPLISFNLAI